VASLDSAIKGLGDQEVIKLIAIGIDKVLGNGASQVFFETLRLVYHFNPSSIPSQLDQFETIARKVMGKKVSQAVFDAIIAEIKAYKKNKKTRS
jgi:hypothetical protein